MRKRLLSLGSILMISLAQPVFAGPLEELFAAGFTESCQKDRMFKDLEESFATLKLPFDNKKGCACLADKIVGDSKVVSQLLADGEPPAYAKLAVIAYASSCLSQLAEEGLKQVQAEPAKK